MGHIIILGTNKFNILENHEVKLLATHIATHIATHRLTYGSYYSIYLSFYDLHNSHFVFL